MTAEQFMKLQSRNWAKINRLTEEIEKARDKVVVPDLSELRPMTPADVVEGAIVYHERSEEHGGWYWHIIESVHRPDDDFKAYVADGCRYGLHQAFVRKGKP